MTESWSGSDSQLLPVVLDDSSMGAKDDADAEEGSDDIETFK